LLFVLHTLEGFVHLVTDIMVPYTVSHVSVIHSCLNRSNTLTCENNRLCLSVLQIDINNMYTHVRLCTEGWQASRFELDSVVCEPSDHENNFRKCPVIWTYIYITIFGFVIDFYEVCPVFFWSHTATLCETIWQHYVQNDGKYLLCDFLWYLN